MGRDHVHREIDGRERLADPMGAHIRIIAVVGMPADDAMLRPGRIANANVLILAADRAEHVLRLPRQAKDREEDTWQMTRRNGDGAAHHALRRQGNHVQQHGVRELDIAIDRVRSERQRKPRASIVSSPAVR